MLRKVEKQLKVSGPVDWGTKIWTQDSVSSFGAFNLLAMISLA